MVKSNYLLKQCPCCSGLGYDGCCRRFHLGRLPKDALELMRSRYCAYAKNLPAYIIKTTHSANPHYCHDHQVWAKQISAFSLSTQFEKLAIWDFQEKESTATVTFTAHLIHNGDNTTFTEKSYFEKVEDQWLYLNGITSSGVVPNLGKEHTE